MNEMIERVAKAMWERTHDGKWEDWGDGQDDSRYIYQYDAKAAIIAIGPPVPPTGLHWLGDRESANATRHALDETACVAYFQRQEDCVRFMEWVGSLCACGGHIEPRGSHDISCPQGLLEVSHS